LNTVLFPGMLLPLHIFEPRYREMIKHCLDGDRTFGVCLIASGPEVGGDANPFPVGTTCEIRTVEPLEDGRMHLVTFGVERFRIRKLIREQAYLEAEVESVPDEEPPELGDLPDAVREATEQYVRRALAAQGEANQEFDLPEDPVALSHLIGFVVPAEPRIRQELLETSVAERLRRGLELLREVTAESADVTDDGHLVARPFRPQRAPSPN
jgi:Lon protease-like protein